MPMGKGMKIGFLLLCGGKSKRMGERKALMDIGGAALMDAAVRAGEGFDVKIFSVNDPQIPTPKGFLRCEDVYPGSGPMAGVHAALRMTDCDALVTAPCDAPYYSAQLAQFLADCYSPALDALILEDESGRSHPLMGVYGKSCLPMLEQHLSEGKYKMMRLLESMHTVSRKLPCGLDSRVFENLNTPQDVRRFEAEKAL